MDRVGDDATRCGTRRTASSTTCCACPTAAPTRLKVRSMVGLLPLCAVDRLRAGELIEQHAASSSSAIAAVPRAASRADGQSSTDPAQPGVERPAPARRSLDETKLRRVLAQHARRERVPRARYGIRALSRVPRASTRTSSTSAAQEYRVDYLPAESDTGMFGGNSNWRGPIWMPVNVLLIRALLQYYALLRRRLHGRVPDRLGPADEPLRGRARRSARPARPASSCATRTAGGRSSAARRSSRTTRTGATTCSSTSTSTATTAPASAPATRPAGPGPVATLHRSCSDTCDPSDLLAEGQAGRDPLESARERR